MIIRNPNHEIRITKHDSRNTEKGAVLIFAFIFLVTLAVVVAAYLTLITRETKSAGSQWDDKIALYIAEAGLQKARWAIETGSALPWQESHNLGPGIYSAWAVDNGDETVTTTSEGYIPQATNYRIRRKVEEVNIPYSANLAYDYDDNDATPPLMSASSSQGANTPANANDGSHTSSWRSTGSAGSWLAVDFGTLEEFNQLVFEEGASEKIATYTVQYWDGANWVAVTNPGESVATVGGHEVTTVTFDLVSSSQVRLYVNTVVTPPPTTKPIVYELEVYGPGDAVLRQGTFTEYW